jgi:hypothetical protein
VDYKVLLLISVILNLVHFTVGDLWGLMSIVPIRHFEHWALIKILLG